MSTIDNTWDGLEDKAFSFIEVVPRPAKPREFGLTILADRGIGLNQVADVLDSVGDYLDWAKIGIGAYRLQREEFLRRKISAYHNGNVRVFFAGDISELACMRVQSDRFYAEVAALGADGVEISSAQVAISLQEKAHLVQMAAAQGLKPIAEAGRKGRLDGLVHSGYLAAQVHAYLEAGAWKVLIQGEGITEGVDIKEHVVFDLVSRFGTESLIFQAKDPASQAWLIDSFGSQVNLDVDVDHLIGLELCRRGLRKRGLFGLVAAVPGRV